MNPMGKWKFSLVYCSFHIKLITTAGRNKTPVRGNCKVDPVTVKMYTFIDLIFRAYQKTIANPRRRLPLVVHSKGKWRTVERNPGK